MMDGVHGRRHEDVAQRFVDPLRQARIGVGEQSVQPFADVEKCKGCRIKTKQNDDGYLYRCDQQDLAGMMT